MPDSQLTPTEIDRIVLCYEKQVSRMFRITIFLTISNLIFILLLFLCPQHVDVNMIHDKTNHLNYKVYK